MRRQLNCPHLVSEMNQTCVWSFEVANLGAFPPVEPIGILHMDGECGINMFRCTRESRLRHACTRSERPCNLTRASPLRCVLVTRRQFSLRKARAISCASWRCRVWLLHGQHVAECVVVSSEPRIDCKRSFRNNQSSVLKFQ